MHPTTRRLLEWYRLHGRDLPWRRDPTPYHTWLSEIMLQQTRVETVIPYYEKFLDRWPTVEDLARAELEDVLGAWVGLGYYRRARNLHRAAAQVVSLGGLPRSASRLRELAGIGPYTAAAIASIAWGQDEVAVDGNLRRVAARMLALELPPGIGAGACRVQRWLEERLPPGRAGDFNQALMDLGATTCLPRRPRCEDCPLARDCDAHRRGLQERVPVRTARRTPAEVAAVALLAEAADGLLLVQRPGEGLLGGLWGPPDRVLAPGEEGPTGLKALLMSLGIASSDPPRARGQVEHLFTHQRWRVQVFSVRLPETGASAAARWWRADAADLPPLSRLAERILERHDAVTE